jgi:hypothetical protein
VVCPPGALRLPAAFVRARQAFSQFKDFRR